MTVEYQQRLGWENGRTKLDELDVLEIRALLAERPRRFSREEIAQQYGVSKSSIQSIAEGRSWAWLDAGTYAAAVRDIAVRAGTVHAEDCDLDVDCSCPAGES